MIPSLETERMWARPVRLEDAEQVQKIFYWAFLIWRRGGGFPQQVKKLPENPSNSLISKRLSRVDLQRITVRCSPRKPGFYPKCVISVIRLLEIRC